MFNALLNGLVDAAQKILLDKFDDFFGETLVYFHHHFFGDYVGETSGGERKTTIADALEENGRLR